ncbi:hypothetical protein LOK49_Contig67G00012 [Camellia lanceoleosa]|nr:hypothetical protein LOK49_Contig67G00012 [Camellia lanceoleosa]
MENFDLEEGSGECEDIFELCLVSKILAPKILNKQATINIIHSAWKIRASLIISSWSDNVFLLQIRHGNASCKFISREEGMNLGYGSEIRTEVARSLGILVETSQKKMDTTENRVNELVPPLRQSKGGTTTTCNPVTHEVTLIELTRVPRNVGVHLGSGMVAG